MHDPVWLLIVHRGISVRAEEFEVRVSFELIFKDLDSGHRGGMPGRGSFDRLRGEAESAEEGVGGVQGESGE